MIYSVILHLFIAVSWILHPFHVSVCDINHNQKSHKLEVSVKIFIDDIGQAVQQNGYPAFAIEDTTDLKDAGKKIFSYLNKKLHVRVDRHPVKFNFLGYEFSDDSILCYLESEKLPKIHDIAIENKLLFDVLDDQINLTHFNYKGKSKTIKTTPDQISELLNVSSW